MVDSPRELPRLHRTTTRATTVGEVIPIRRGRRKREGPCWRMERAGYYVLRVKGEIGWRAVALIVRGEDGWWWYSIPGRDVTGRTLSALPVIKRELFARVAEGP